MDFSDKIKKLQCIIDSMLLPEISGDYVLLDLPYYTNIGDTLIWEGTKQFLKTLPYKCIYSSDMNFYVERELSDEVVILLLGGGNFGDIYREHSIFRKRIIERYPNNKIIILPQSVHYTNNDNLNADVEFYSNYSNVIICAREKYSYDVINQCFTNKVLLVPDMAFYIDLHPYSILPSLGKTLFLKRSDLEYVEQYNYLAVPENAEIHDWPTYESTSLKLRLIDWIFRFLKLLFAFGNRERKNRLEDIKRDCFYREAYVQMGINFLSKYESIYTTRLHVLILAVLLNKQIYIFNNSTGKLANFYNTWLSDVPNIIMINETAYA